MRVHEYTFCVFVSKYASDISSACSNAVALQMHTLEWDAYPLCFVDCCAAACCSYYSLVQQKSRQCGVVTGLLSEVFYKEKKCLVKIGCDSTDVATASQACSVTSDFSVEADNLVINNFWVLWFRTKSFRSVITT